MSAQNISPERFHELYRSGHCTLLDVRSPAEYRELHVRGAVNVPLNQLTAEQAPQPPDGEPLYVVCHKGGRSAQACQKLVAAGMSCVVNIEGGTLGCQQAGLPVVEGQQSVSLERQVRIAAGSLVLLGIGLSFLHPAWLGISAFVGAGLVFSGITNTCGMGLLLARMPWNQVGASPASPESK